MIKKKVTIKKSATKTIKPKATKVKVSAKKKITTKVKAKAKHVKSFYRPKTAREVFIDFEEQVEYELHHLVWVPVALTLAATSIGLNLMLAITFSQ